MSEEQELGCGCRQPRQQGRTGRGALAAPCRRCQESRDCKAAEVWSGDGEAGGGGGGQGGPRPLSAERRALELSQPAEPHHVTRPPASAGPSLSPPPPPRRPARRLPASAELPPATSRCLPCRLDGTLSSLMRCRSPHPACIRRADS